LIVIDTLLRYVSRRTMRNTVEGGCTKRENEGAKGPTINRELAILKHAFNLGTFGACEEFPTAACQKCPTLFCSGGSPKLKER
jgi:hypothetical protein